MDLDALLAEAAFDLDALLEGLPSLDAALADLEAVSDLDALLAEFPVFSEP